MPGRSTRALRGEFTGGLLCQPGRHRRAPHRCSAALRAHSDGRPGRLHLAARPGGGRAVARTPSATTRGAWHRGDLVVLCPGAAHTGVAGPHLAAWRGAAGAPGPAADDADRAVRRAADHLARRRRLAALLPRLRPARPARAAAAVPGRGRGDRRSCCWCSGLDGGLTIGDTHEYDEPFAFDVDEDAYDHLRGRAEALLGAALPPVQRRWAGVYSRSPTVRAVPPLGGGARRGPGHRPGRPRA